MHEPNDHQDNLWQKLTTREQPANDSKFIALVEPAGTDQRIKAILKKTKEQGSIDLTAISVDEQKQIKDWYCENFDKIGTELGNQLLEQFMAHEIVSDGEATTFLSKMEPDSQNKIGVFIANSLRPDTYVKAFQECWAAFTLYQKFRFKKEFTLKHPEGALRIAPFVRLWETRVKIGDEINSFTNKHFSNLRDAQKLFDTALAYEDAHPKSRAPLDNMPYAIRQGDSDIQKKWKESPRMSLQYLESCGDGTFSAKRNMLTITRLSALFERGLITQNEIETMLDTNSLPYLDKEKLLTDDEKKEFNKLTEIFNTDEELKNRLKEYSIPYGFEYLHPRENAVKAMKIVERANARYSGELVEVITRFIEDPEKRVDLFIELANNDFFILGHVEKMNLSKKQVYKMIQKISSMNYGVVCVSVGFTELKAVLDFDKRESGPPSIETLIVKELLRAFAVNGAQNYLVLEIIQDIETFLTLFNKTNSDEIKYYLIHKQPELLVGNIAFAIKNEADIDKVTASATSDPDLFLQYYFEFIHHLTRHKGKKGVPSVESIREQGRILLEAHPAFLYNKSTEQRVVRELITDEQRDQIIEKNLRPPVNKYFLRKLFEMPQTRERYHDKIKQVFLNDNDAFASQCYAYNLNNVGTMIGWDKFFNRSLNIVDSNFDSWIFAENNKWLEILAKPGNPKRLVEAFQKSGREEFIADVACQIDIAAKKKKRSFVTKDEKISVSFTRLSSMLIFFLETLKRAVRQNPDLAFRRAVLESDLYDPSEHVNKHVARFARANPGILIDILVATPNTERTNSIDESHLNDLVLSHARSLAYSKGVNRYDLKKARLREEVGNKICELNPFLSILESDALPKDAYEIVLDKIRGTPFYWVCARELEQHVKAQHERVGEVLDGKSFYPEKIFINLVKRVSLLNDFPLALKNAEYLSKLPSKKSKIILDQLELLSKFVDDSFSLDMSQETLAQTQTKLSDRIRGHFKETFGVDTGNAEIDLDPILLSGLATYYQSKIASTTCLQKPFAEFARHLFAGKGLVYKEWGSENPPTNDKEEISAVEQMKQTGLLPQNISAQQYKIWREPFSVSANEVLSYTMKEVQSSIHEILAQSLVDAHIDSDTLNKTDQEIEKELNELNRPVEELNERLRELTDKITSAKASKKTSSNAIDLTQEESEEYLNLKEEIANYYKENREQMNSLIALKYVRCLEQISARELEEEMFQIGKNKIAFGKIFRAIQNGLAKQFPAFTQDIQRINDVLRTAKAQMFNDKQVSRNELIITDENDFTSSILVGVEPVESCQHFSDGSFNECLLAFSIDPNVHIMRIVGSDGSYVARAVLRLLQDTEGNPQLFLERVYSTNCHPKISEIMTTAAKQKAKEMGVGLFSIETVIETSPPTGLKTVQLENRASRAPFVYTDAGGGEAVKGRFTINNAKKISN